MTKSVYSQRGKSSDKSIKRDTKWPNDVKKWKKQFHIFFKKHQNRANIRKPEKAAKNWEFQCTNKPKDTKTAQTCQKSRERWQKINKNRSNMSESQRKVTKNWVQTNQKVQKRLKHARKPEKSDKKLSANKPKATKNHWKSSNAKWEQ